MDVRTERARVRVYLERRERTGPAARGGPAVTAAADAPALSQRPHQPVTPARTSEHGAVAAALHEKKKEKTNAPAS